MSSSRLKKPAARNTPQSRDDVAADIRAIGDLARERLRATTAMNDRIAAITAEYQPQLEAADARLAELRAGVQTWCEAHREELTRGGRSKTINLVTGEVSWRQRPPSVSVRGAEAVIDTLRRLGLDRFVRVREEVNREAVLHDPDAVSGIAGIRLVRGVEDFVIAPFEQEAP